MSRPRILINAAVCLVCGDRIESTHRHDYVKCACGNIAVDGGRDYLRRAYLTAENEGWKDASVTEERRIRDRGGSGMSMLEPDHASMTRHRNVQRGRTLQLHEDRVAAFGAIRRAASVAREYDSTYGEAYLARDWDTCSVTSDGNGIRRAIRAAIGSDKT